METIDFLVQGSAAEPYQVRFTRNGNTINAFCSCPAGDSGTACKHRLSILSGLKTSIVSDNVQLVATVASWLPQSNIEMRLAELDRAEREAEAAKKAVAAAKKRLAAAMLGRE